MVRPSPPQIPVPIEILILTSRSSSQNSLILLTSRSEMTKEIKVRKLEGLAPNFKMMQITIFWKYRRCKTRWQWWKPWAAKRSMSHQPRIWSEMKRISKLIKTKSTSTRSQSPNSKVRPRKNKEMQTTHLLKRPSNIMKNSSKVIKNPKSLVSNRLNSMLRDSLSIFSSLSHHLGRIRPRVVSRTIISNVSMFYNN